MQAVIDLVGYEGDVARAGLGDQGGQRIARQHGARRVAGRRDDQSLQIHPLQIGRHGLQAVLGPRGQAHGHQRQRAQDLAIAGIARLPQADPVPRIEQRREGQKEGPGRARRDDDAIGVQVDAIPSGIEPRDAMPQGWQAKRHGIAKGLVVHRPGQCGTRNRGGRAAGLAHLHMDDRAALLFQQARGLDDIHHDEGIDLTAP